MIISRTPLRISLFGGGSDLPEFYSQETGKVLSLSINKYIYIASHNEFDGKYRLAYSKSEEVMNLDEISHPIFRHTLSTLGVRNGIEIGSFADIPSKGSGLGSSSAFTVGLLANLLRVNGDTMTQSEIAARAFDIERNQIGDSVGKQDHYGTAIGGVKKLIFKNSEEVEVEFVRNSKKLLEEFPNLLRLVYTGIPRNANSFLKEQGSKTQSSRETFSTICELRDFVDPGKDALERGDYQLIAKFLNESWQIKKKISTKISLEKIDSIYEDLRECGIWGAKLLGAGGGGFLIGIGDPEAWINYKTKNPGIKVLNFDIDLEGVKTYEI
jgi:D-glycero-alpha-D-manno-heptose-7-phosphate kinase